MTEPIYLLVVSTNTTLAVGGFPETRVIAAVLVEPISEDETELEMVDRIATPAMLGHNLLALSAAGARPYTLDPRASPAA